MPPRYRIKNKHIANALDNIMGVEEASQLWGLAPGYIKNLCNQRRIKAKKIGKTWVIDKIQPNPRKGV